MTAKRIGISIFIGVMILFACRSALAETVYTTDADFDLGTLVDVNHDPPNNDQLQLNTTVTSFVFVNVAASGRGTIIRIDADTGDILGEYKTAPEGRGLNPSRTSVDSLGNVWTTNRDEAGEIDGTPFGSAVKIGLIIGGTRVTIDENGDVTPDPAGEYLEPPFEYSTCIDRDEDGLIKTSRGLGNILPWPDLADGVGGADGVVEDAEDECILLYQRVADAEEAHHVSVDADDDVWVGGYPLAPVMFHKLDGDTGAMMDSFDADAIGCGGFGGLVDDNGILWSADPAKGQLMYYDPDPDIRAGGCIPITESFGVGIDSNGFIWNTLFNPDQIAKIDPDPSGPSIVDGFPKNSDDAFLAPQGVAVTPGDNNVWVANSGGDEVLRLDNDGVFRALIEVGEIPTGVAVDANGKVWVANLGSDNVMRIDPDPGDDELGAVDLTVELGDSADPDNYSDMASVITKIETSPQGTWTIVNDSGTPGNSWGTITWNTEPEGSQPEGTNITVEARAADSEVGLEAESYMVVLNGVPFALTGRFIQIRATLKPDSEGTSPVLSDLKVESVPAETVPCDVDEDGIIDIYDIFGILFSIGDTSDGPDDPRDWDGDGNITIADVKGCVSECTNQLCKP
jgi:DNA-binding beta-propeller fold protein YncE